VTCSIRLANAAEPDSLPRYRFEVGQEITYESAAEYNYGGIDGITVAQHLWRFRIVRRNSDGTWRAIVQKSEKSFDQRAARANFGYCDISNSGRVTGNDSLSVMIDPADVFVSLPIDINQQQNGWETVDQITDTVRTSRLQKSKEPHQVAIDVQQETPLDVIYDSTRRSLAHFDRNRGLVAQIETETSQGWGAIGKGSVLVELKSVVTKDIAWCDALLRDAEFYFDTAARYDKLLKRAEREPENVDSLLNEAGALLATAREKISANVVLDELNHKLQRHESAAKSAREESDRRSQIVGQPAPDWEAADFDGRQHSLAQYRGKVLVLDFWYRGCGWCIREMPQVKEIAASFANQPVAVLGMNTDQKEEDARFVMDKMGLNYPTLKARELPEKLNVTGFPTTIVIDQDGIVRDIHVGYSPTLRDEISAVVKKLLTQSEK
jgi:peroxiredoxin